MNPSIPNFAFARGDGSKAMNLQPVFMLEACSTSQHDVLERMITQGHDVNHVWPGHLRLLHIAASRGDVRSLELLLDAQADADAVTARGETALYLAACEGHGLVVTQLQRAGADINLSNHRGETPLHAAMATGHFSCARQLLWMGALTQCRNIHGLRAEDAAPMAHQPKELVELFRAAKLRARKD